MQILLNRERIAAEIMELARIKISIALRVPLEEVGGRFEYEAGKAPTPVFEVDMDKVKGMNEDEIRQSMGATWRWLKDNLYSRLEGLGQERGKG